MSPEMQRRSEALITLFFHVIDFLDVRVDMRPSSGSFQPKVGD